MEESTLDHKNNERYRKFKKIKDREWACGTHVYVCLSNKIVF